MAKRSTYSFTDLAGALTHPDVGDYIFSGEGIGEINIEMATEKTAHDVAADGAVMISKIAGENGTIAIQCQQTSPLHKYLLNWYNDIINADASVWAAMSASLRNVVDGTSHFVTGISPQKRAGKVYQKQGQNVTWTLMAADITEEAA